MLGTNARTAGTCDPSDVTLQIVVSPLRVLVVDDHPVFRAGLRGLIDGDPELVCVDVATTAGEAVDKAQVHRPDVIAMDISLPDGSGVNATRRILERHPDCGVLMLTMHDDERRVMEALRAGARGYVVKGSDADDVVRAIKAVGRGEAIFGAGIAELLLSQVVAAPDPASRAFPDLTAREREILEGLADGDSNGQVANRLGLSPKTVRNHVSAICNKLQVVDRSQAALRAREAGLGKQRDD